jgi:hypothetical protein
MLHSRGASFGREHRDQSVGCVRLHFILTIISRLLHLHLDLLALAIPQIGCFLILLLFGHQQAHTRDTQEYVYRSLCVGFALSMTFIL